MGGDSQMSESAIDARNLATGDSNSGRDLTREGIQYRSALPESLEIVEQVWASFEREWPYFFAGDSGVDHIRDRIAGDEGRSVGFSNYNTFALTFNRAFLFKNLLKTSYALIVLRNKGFAFDGNVIDVGCGAGVFSIAWHFVFPRYSGQLILIDQSEAQLDIAARTNKLLGIKRRRQCLGKFEDRLPDLPGLRLMSYWLCEQQLPRIAVGRSQQRIFDRLIDCGIIAVDYPQILCSFDDLISTRAVSTMWSNELVLPPKWTERIADHVLNVSVLHVENR